MESTDNTPTASPAPGARRSGRVTRAPEKFVPETSAVAKRKRTADDEDEDLENAEPEDDDDVGDEDAEDTATEEDGARTKRKRPASQAARTKKPAAKKPKTNGAGPLGSAHAAALPSRPKARNAPRLIDGADYDSGGIFAVIFGSGQPSDKVAEHWHENYKNDSEAAVTDLVNCILRSSGCDEKVTEDDIRDPDNIQNRLSELQELYQEQQITEYPLAKAKTSRQFRDLLVNFFDYLINLLHEDGILYSDVPLLENITRWVGTMSSSSLRPFRHTATTIALALQTALVDVARTLDKRIQQTTASVDSQKSSRGKNRNKDLLASLQQTLDEDTRRRETCGEQIRDFFDIVFVHRYRDVDPRIRTECVEAIGSWIMRLPTVFMSPEYLRYLGWMLSDINPPTRHEVLKQLSKIFGRHAEGLGHFIDRFRPRLMEMATKDSDVSVRVAAISVIETLEAKGMLEPEEIDTTGKLIFDSEPRVRRAVVNFFAHCVDESVNTKIEEIGGKDAIDELFADNTSNEETPREWLQIKVLAEILAVYDAQVDEGATEVPNGLDAALDVVNAGAPETRISLAAQALYETLDVVREWQGISSYLLFDHSTSTKSKSKAGANSSKTKFRKAVAPEAQEEPILLEVLASAVKMSLTQSTEPERHKKKPVRTLAPESKDKIALHLANTIPKLLKKFGAEPSTATLVLRLEHFLDLDVSVQLRQAYAPLLDEICTQFSRHVDRGVLSEASAALLHARKYVELEEVVDSKLSGLWDDVLNTLRNFQKSNELSIRGNLDESLLTELSNNLAKIAKLASISDCVVTLEAKNRSDETQLSGIDILVQTVHRGKYDRVDEELDDLEDEVTSHAIRCSQFYFMWKVRSLMTAIDMQTPIANADIDRVSMLRKVFQTNLIHTLSSRASNDDLRLLATGSLCDLNVLFSALPRHIEQWRGVGAEKRYAGLQVLVHEIPLGLVRELVSIFDGAERAYAKKTKKTLNEPAEDDDPVDDDLLSDDEDEEEFSPEEKRVSELKAEKALCELAAKFVLAIHAKVLDHSGPQPGKLKRRLLRNQLKLGHNFRDTVAYLDETKAREAVSGSKKAVKEKGKQPAEASKKTAVSEEIIVAADDSDDNAFDDSEPEEGTVEDLRRRELLDEQLEEPDSYVENGQANDAVEDDDILGD